MIGELEADRSGGPRRGVDRQMIDPVRRADPAVERGRIGLRTGDQARQAAKRLRPFKRIDVILYGQHRGGVDRLALEDALDELATLGHAEDLDRKSTRLNS